MIYTHHISHHISINLVLSYHNINARCQTSSIPTMYLFLYPTFASNWSPHHISYIYTVYLSIRSDLLTFFQYLTRSTPWFPHGFPMVSPWFPRGRLQDFVLLHLWRRLPRKLPAVASFHEAMAPQLLGVDQLTEDARGPGQATAYGTARRGVFEWCFWGKMGEDLGKSRGNMRKI
jgi:hypothetical protein